MNKKEIQDFPVDLVYTWVDGSDKEWRKRKALFCSNRDDDGGLDGNARYHDNGELRYSLRSAELYAPWIRKIFIITDKQCPEWLDTKNPKIQIIDHSEILPPEALPTFNSTVIEHSLHNIPGLSEHFLYANDDMFFNRDVKISDFFTPKGYPIIRFNRKPFRKLWLYLSVKVLKKKLNNYNLTIQTASRLVENRFGKYIGHKTHHNIDAYCKSLNARTFSLFENEIRQTFSNHTRADSDIQRNLYSYVPVAEKKSKVKFVSQSTSFRCHIEHPHYLKDLSRMNPMLFCLNDSQYADDNCHRLVGEFLSKRFPNKSSFEK